MSIQTEIDEVLTEDVYDRLPNWTRLSDRGGFQILLDGAVLIIAPQQARHGTLSFGEVPVGISLSKENFVTILSEYNAFMKSKAE